MQSKTIHSDQLYNWSAHERLHRHLASSASSLGQKAGPARTFRPSRLPHRALQAVRPSWLQMPTGPGPWTKILSLGQPGRRPPRDGLCPRGTFSTGLRLLAELPESPPSAGTGLQYQPRVITAPSEVLTPSAHGAFILIPARSRLGWDPRRQSLAELVAGRLGFAPNSKEGDLR